MQVFILDSKNNLIVLVTCLNGKYHTLISQILYITALEFNLSKVLIKIQDSNW